MIHHHSRLPLWGAILVFGSVHLTGCAASDGEAVPRASGGAPDAGGGATSDGAVKDAATWTSTASTQVSTADYRLTSAACNLVMEVNSQIGARVTKLSMGGADVIVPFACTAGYNGNDGCNASGSTFWTSPQSAWPAFWPPVVAVDGNSYTPTVSGSHLVATSARDEALGARVTKDFSTDEGTCWTTLLYTIEATKDISMAPWEITRVPRGGVALFPLGDAAKLAPGPLAAYTTTNAATTPNVVWFDDTSKAAANSGGSKLIADGADGWLAYAVNGYLFIKKYPDVTPASLAPGEGDIEIYADTSGFLELEVQGPYSALSTGSQLPWAVQWRVVPLPSSVVAAAGDPGLLAFAQQQVGVLTASEAGAASP